MMLFYTAALTKRRSFPNIYYRTYGFVSLQRHNVFVRASKVEVNRCLILPLGGTNFRYIYGVRIGGLSINVKQL